jgi:hypothetical protein
MAEPLTPVQLDEYQDLADTATPGPWHLTNTCEIAAPLTNDTIADVWEPTQASRNGEFIAAARTAVPALLADNHRLRAQVVFLLGAMARKDTHTGDAEEALRAFLTGDEQPEDDDESAPVRP